MRNTFILKLRNISAFLLTISALFPVVGWGQNLRFTSGSVSGTNFPNVVLQLAGPSNLWVHVQRLGQVSQVWSNVGTNWMGSSGTLTVTQQLDNGSYGFFRARSTNGNHLSTNGFGAVVGTLDPTYSLLGNPFTAKDISQLILSPPEGLTVYKWLTASNSYQSADYGFGEWSHPLSVGQMDAVLVMNPTTNPVSYTVQGLFNTNLLSKSIPVGMSLIGSPLYRLLSTDNLVDRLGTNLLGGLSSLPVRSPGFAVESSIQRLKSSTNLDYTEYKLTNAAWYSGSVKTNVDLYLTEGFWLYKPTNATWTVRLPLW